MSTLVEMIEALQAKWRTSGDMLEARAYGRCVNALAPILAAASEQEQQHSDDLRKVAEMAIAECRRSLYQAATERGHENAYAFANEYWPKGADSIVREFREQKAQVGK